MKLIEILISSSLRPARISPVAVGAEIYGVKLVRAFEQRYGFLEPPRSVADFRLDEGIDFRHGYFQGHVINLQIKQESVRIISKGGTELCDACIRDMEEFASTISEDLTIEVSHNFKIYETALEVQMDGNFEAVLATFSDIGAAIGKAIGTYGGPDTPYRGIGVSLVARTDEKGPVSFRFERRSGHPIDSGVYFTTSPLSTPDHVAVLEMLEKAIS